MAQIHTNPRFYRVIPTPVSVVRIGRDRGWGGVANVRSWARTVLNCDRESAQRANGLGSMVSTAESELGMSFETSRTLEVMKEFCLTGLAGANLPSPKDLIKDPAFKELLASSEPRDFLLYTGGVEIEEWVKGLL